MCALTQAAANGGLRVLVIDSDLRNAKLHQLFGLNNDSGLTDLLKSIPEELDDASLSNLISKNIVQTTETSTLASRTHIEV